MKLVTVHWTWNLLLDNYLGVIVYLHSRVHSVLREGVGPPTGMEEDQSGTN